MVILQILSGVNSRRMRMERLRNLCFQWRAKKKEATMPRREEKRMIFDPNIEKENIRRQPAAEPVRLNPYNVPAFLGFCDRGILMVNPAKRNGSDNRR